MTFPFGRGLIPRWFEKRCSRIRYPQFNWFVIWTVTRFCNLDCSYCYVDDRKNREYDLPKAVAEIEKARPRFLGLHGGEPVLADGLPHALDRIKEVTPQTFILTETNATMPDKVIECLPRLNHVEVSLDGLGEVNKKVRGVNGDVILENFMKIRNEAKKTGSTVSISTVLTTVNYRHFHELVEAVNDFDPKIGFAVFVMHPRTNPLSVRYDDDVWKESLQILEDISSRYPQVVFKGDMTVRDQCRCGAQYFIRHLKTDGTWHDCKPHMHIEIFRRKTANARGLKGQLQILKHAWHLFDVLLLRKKKGLTCLEPCDWGEPLNPVFGLEDRMDESLVKMIGVLDEFEKEKVLRFVRKNINSRIEKSTIDRVFRT